MPQGIAAGVYLNDILAKAFENRLHGHQLIRHIVHNQNVDGVVARHGDGRS
jgi:hypothetical protein